MPKVKRSSSAFTPSDYPRVRRLLMRRDKVLAAAIKRIGPCGLDARQHSDHLTALTRAIVGQQLSSKAAATIFSRFVALFPDASITAERIQALDDQTLRGVGLSSQKL
jgi:3-methyladenine DNA glycosylase/8-oxoguanine DNA glycosylase